MRRRRRISFLSIFSLNKIHKIIVLGIKMSKFRTDLAKLCVDLLTEARVVETTPPGMEQWVKDQKADFKNRYGDKWASVLYATAWKRHNKKHTHESVLHEYANQFDLTGYGAWFNVKTKQILPAINKASHITAMKKLMATQGVDTATDVYKWAAKNHWLRLIFNWNAGDSDSEFNTLNIDGNTADIKAAYRFLVPLFNKFANIEISNPEGDFIDFDMPGDLSKLRKWLKETNQINNFATDLTEITDYADPAGGAMISPYDPDPDDRDLDSWYDWAEQEITAQMQNYSDVFSSKETFLQHYDEVDLPDLVSEIVSDGLANAAKFQDDEDLFYQHVDAAQLTKEWLEKIKKQLGFIEENTLQRLTTLAGIK
jgi:hypothetical protein